MSAIVCLMKKALLSVPAAAPGVVCQRPRRSPPSRLDGLHLSGAASPQRNNTPQASNIPAEWDVGSFDRKTNQWQSESAQEHQVGRPAGFADLRHAGDRGREGLLRNQQRGRLAEAVPGLRRPGLPALFQPGRRRLPLAAFLREAQGGQGAGLAATGYLRRAHGPGRSALDRDQPGRGRLSSIRKASKTARTTAPTARSRPPERASRTLSGCST